MNGVILSAIFLSSIISSFNMTVVSTALPTIAEHFSNFNHITWIVTIYLVAATISIPIFGKFSDYLNRKHAILISVGGVLIGSIVCGVFNNFFILLVGRAIQGVGSGGIFSLVYVIVSDLVAPRDSGKYQGYLSIAFAFGSITGPIIGGFLAENLYWRWCFWVSLPFCILTLFLCSKIPSNRKFKKSDIKLLDIKGAIFLTVLMVSIMLVVEQIKNIDSNLFIIGVLACSVVIFLVLLIKAELKSKTPIIPMNLFLDSTYLISLIIIVLVMAGYFVLLIFVPLELQISKNMSLNMSGLVLISYIFFVPISSYTVGHMIHKRGKYKTFIVVGLFIITISLTTLIFFHTKSIWFGVAILMLAGFGTGMIFPSLGVAVQNSLPDKDLSAGISLFIFSRFFGGSLGIAIITVIFNSYLVHSLGQNSTKELLTFFNDKASKTNSFALNMLDKDIVSAFNSSFGLSYLAILVFSILALVLSFFIKQNILKDRVEEFAVID